MKYNYWKNRKIMDVNEWLLTPRERMKAHQFTKHIPCTGEDQVKRAETEISIERLSTGLDGLDTYAGGLAAGTITVIATRDEKGATALLNQIVRHNALTKGIPTAYFSIDPFGFVDIARRLVTLDTGIAYEDLLQGKLTDTQWKIVSKFSNMRGNLPFYLYQIKEITPDQILRYLQDIYEAQNLELIAFHDTQMLHNLWAEQYGLEAYSMIVSLFRKIADDFGATVVTTWGVDDQIMRGIWPRIDQYGMSAYSQVNPYVETIWAVWDAYLEHDADGLLEFQLQTIKQPTMAMRHFVCKYCQDTLAIDRCVLLNG